MSETNLEGGELLEIPEQYDAWVTDSETTGLRLFKLKNKDTGVTTTFVEYNDHFDSHATPAWAGARKSRSDDSPEDIFEEIETALKEDKYTAGQKLSNVFTHYGHASVADMSSVMIFLDDIPMHEAFWLFNHTSVGGGQELSTRYVELDDLGIAPLAKRLGLEEGSDVAKKVEKQWNDLQGYAADRYNHWVSVLREPLVEHIRATIGPDEKISPSTLDARVLDVARMWIPVGASTSMALMTSARNYVDIAGQMRSAAEPRLNSLGDQIVTLMELKGYEGFEDMQAELGDITKSKYYEGSEVLTRNIIEVEDYLLENTDFADRFSDEIGDTVIHSDEELLLSESRVRELKFETPGEAVLLQYIHVAAPAIDEGKIQTFIRELDEGQLRDLGEIIFSDHSHHELMRNAGDVRGSTFTMETALGYLRDFNRHRAMGRLVTMLETPNFDQVLGAGFNMNHQIANTVYWKHLKDDWQADAEGYYDRLASLYGLLSGAVPDFDSRVLQDILPLGHQTKLHMSGPATQWSYLTSLRIGLGGDFGYRKVTWDILEELRKDPVISGMSRHLTEPDPNDVIQILGRS